MSTEREASTAPRSNTTCQRREKISSSMA